MMTGPLLAWIQKLAVQCMTTDIYTCFPIIASNDFHVITSLLNIVGVSH